MLALSGVIAAAALQAQMTIEIRPAPAVQLPAPIDSNSPGHWRDGTFVLFNSEGVPYRSQGTDQFSLAGTADVGLARQQPSPVWIEATWLDEDGTLFAWYHHEPGGLCKGSSLTAPKIGALVSYDNGRS